MRHHTDKGGFDAVAQALREGSRTVREIMQVVDVIGRHRIQRILNQMLADGLVTVEVRRASETNVRTRFFTLSRVNNREVEVNK